MSCNGKKNVKTRQKTGQKLKKLNLLTWISFGACETFCEKDKDTSLVISRQTQDLISLLYLTWEIISSRDIKISQSVKQWIK